MCDDLLLRNEMLVLLLWEGLRMDPSLTFTSVRMMISFDDEK